MSAVLGVVFLCVAWLGLNAALALYRRPVPPRWATASLAAELITVGILGIGVFGFALLVELAVTADYGSIGVLEGVLIVAALAATVFLTRRPRRSRTAGDIAAPGASGPTAAA